MISTKLVKWIKQAGKPTEEDSSRDGFLSYSGEVHGIGVGISAGFIATSFGDTKLLGVIYGAIVYGNSNGMEGRKRRDIIKDVIKEWHYTLAGIVVGSVLGISTRVVARLAGIELPNTLLQ